MSFPNAAQKHTNAMENFKWHKDWKKQPSLVKINEQMQMINALDLDVPRSLQVSPVLSEWGIAPVRGKFFRVKPESEELTRRRMAMLKEDQKKLKAKKDEEEAQRAERARTKEIQEAGEKVQIQLVGIEITD